MTWKKLSANQTGFTLIELLIVISIVSLLAFIVFVVINPSQRLRESHDNKRTSDVKEIISAVHEYIVDNKGTLPSGLTTGMAEAQIGTATTGCTITTGGCSVAATACVDLTMPLAKYLKNVPIDPTGGNIFTAAKTGYSIAVDTNNIVTVKACGTEGSTNISQSR